MTDNYYTPKEIADILKVNEKTVQKWLREGKLRGVHVGRLWRISEGQLDKFLGGHN